jgi:hypothetical protein
MGDGDEIPEELPTGEWDPARRRRDELEAAIREQLDTASTEAKDAALRRGFTAHRQCRAHQIPLCDLCHVAWPCDTSVLMAQALGIRFERTTDHVQ